MGWVIALAVFLAVWNNAANRVRGFQHWYVPINLAVAAGLVGVAWTAGVPLAALGLARESMARGLLVGAVAAVVVAAGLGVALAVPALRPLLADQRVVGLSPAGLAGYAALRVPLGTVVLEEVAFRGVLLAAWLHQGPTLVAVIGSSVVFGLWHVVPTCELLRINRPHAGPAVRVAGITAGVAVTTLAGVLLCGLRLVTGGLVAPAMAHWAANGLGAAAGWAAARLHTYGSSSSLPRVWRSSR